MTPLLDPSSRHDASAPSILAENLTYKYDKEFALNQLSFQLMPGQRIAIVGPNGAGKTTLFKLIAGILKPSGGSISVHGHTPGEHICIAYLPQRSEVDWKFPVTVRDVVMMGRIRKIGLFRWPRANDWDFVQDALIQVRMADLGNRQIGELSGGQQQRVFLAQAIAQEAEIILLDEPLTGLDVPSQENIYEILENFSREDVTVLVATHDLNMASERFDEVMLLNRRLVAFGAPETVFTRETLLDAYGGQLHVVSSEEELTVLADIHNLGGN